MNDPFEGNPEELGLPDLSNEARAPAASASPEPREAPKAPETTSIAGAASEAPAKPAKPAGAEHLGRDGSTHSMETERMLIGVILNPQRAEVHHQVMSLLGHEDFFVEQHQVIWRIAAALRDAGLPPDPTAVIDAAANEDSFVGGVQYVLDAVGDPVAKICSNESVQIGAQRVKTYAMSRRLQRSLSQGAALLAAGEPFTNVMQFVSDDLANLERLSKSSRSGPVQASVFYTAMVERIQARASGIESVDAVSTGLPELDRALGGGLAKEDLIIIGGRPAMGKTAFATAIEQNISLRGRPTLTFSLEMTGLSLVQRNTSRHSRIPFNHIRTAAVREQDFNDLVDSIEVLSAAPCYIDETPGLTLPEVRSRARSFVAQHPLGVIFVDYLQLISMSGNKDPRLVVSEISRGLKQLARELQCPVVALAQLNRDLERRANKRPMMADLRESGQVEQDASVIIFLYRDEVYNPDSPERGITEAIIGKNRDGETRTIKYASDLSRMAYSEIGTYDTQTD